MICDYLQYYPVDLKPNNINNNVTQTRVWNGLFTFIPIPLSIAEKLVFSVFYLLDTAVMTIFLFHWDPPIPTALRPDACLEPPFMGPCKAKLSKHSYNATFSFWQIFEYGS